MTDTVSPGDVVRLEGLDLPSGARFHYIHNGEMRLRVMTAPANRQDARGSVIFSPGRTEFIEKYFEFAEDLIARGFAVLILDPRGQGLSERILDDPIKSHIDNFEHYSDDLALAVNVFKEDLPKPHIVIGHSMGGLVALQTILTGRLNPAACVLSAPMLAVHDLATPIMPHVLKLLSWFGMSKSNLPFQNQRSGLPVSFKINKLTSDPNRYQLWATYFENHKKLRVGPPTYGWICAAMKAMKFVNENARHLKIPTLMVAAGADPIVIPASVEEFANKAGADYLNIPGALHEIILERDVYRDQFWEGFDAFLEKNAL
jgi:lysophospholipase